MEKNFFIKIGNRYLSWVDENWYETNKKEPTYFTWHEIIDAVKLLEKHYIFNPFIFQHYEEHDNLCFIEK